jgi:hypothetical protein
MLAGGFAVDVECGGEGGEGEGGKVREVDLGVIGMLGSDMTRGGHEDAKAGMGVEEGGKSLGCGEVKEGGEVTALADASR